LPTSVFHIELRQFPHTARAFNLSEEELRTQILTPWVAGRDVERAQREFSPRKARLTVISGPELAAGELGMGRGWQQAMRSGEDVTEVTLDGARRAHGGGEALEALKQELLALCGAEPPALGLAAELAGAHWPQQRVSERLALAEQAVWELLHERRLQLLAGDPSAPVPEEQWRALVMSWSGWSGSGEENVRLAAFGRV